MSKRQIYWALAIGVVALAAYTANALAPKSAMSFPSATQTFNPSAISAERLDSAPVRVRAPSRPALRSYGATVRDDLFAAPQPKNRPVRQTREPVPHASFPQAPAGAPNDLLADSVYAGSFTIDGRTIALIESRSTKRGAYVEAGEDWQGFRVLAISQDDLSLSVNGTTRHLSKSDTINLVPLSANAPGGTAGAEKMADSQSQVGGERRSGAMALQELNLVPERETTVQRLEILTDLRQANESDPGPPVTLDFGGRL